MGERGAYSDVRGRVVSEYGAHRYRVLFYTLLVTLAANPLLTALRFSGDVLQIFLVFSLLIAILDVPEQRWRLVMIVVVAVAVGLWLAPAAALGRDVGPAAIAGLCLVALAATTSAARFAMRSRVIGSEHIYAALSAYLLAGLMFGVLHWAVGLARPGSFGEASAAGPPAPFPLSTAIYYSFVTLATLGYGDVVPKTETARGLAVLEAVGGQLYVAVMIAHLVGARAAGVPPPGGSRGEIAGDPR